MKTIIDSALTFLLAAFLAFGSLYFSGCADDCEILDVKNVNDVYIGWAGMYSDPETPYTPALIEHNSIVVDGSNVEVGVFNDACLVNLASEQPGWQDVARVCQVPYTGQIFIMERASIVIYGGAYLLVVEGTIDFDHVSYSAVMGLPEGGL